MGRAGHWIADRRLCFHEPREPLSLNVDHKFRTRRLGWALGGFTFIGQLGAALPADSAAQSPVAKQTGAPRVLGVGLGSRRGWG
jgi:hypothetical protein